MDLARAVQWRKPETVTSYHSAASAQRLEEPPKLHSWQSWETGPVGLVCKSTAATRWLLPLHASLYSSWLC